MYLTYSHLYKKNFLNTKEFLIRVPKRTQPTLLRFYYSQCVDWLCCDGVTCSAYYITAEYRTSAMQKRTYILTKYSRSCAFGRKGHFKNSVINKLDYALIQNGKNNEILRVQSIWTKTMDLPEFNRFSIRLATNGANITNSNGFAMKCVWISCKNYLTLKSFKKINRKPLILYLDKVQHAKICKNAFPIQEIMISRKKRPPKTKTKMKICYVALLPPGPGGMREAMN